MSLQGGQPKKAVAPKCKCGALLGTGPKLVVDGWWACPDCVYRDEHPDAEGARRPKRSVPLQEETLFPLVPARRNE